MEAILLLGLAGLFIFTLMLSSRVRHLEARLEDSRAPALTADPDPLFEGRRRPAVVIRSAASPAPPPPVLEETWPEPASATERDRDWPDPDKRETLGAFFERWVGGRLLIWVGGIAFATGGVFLVRYS